MKSDIKSLKEEKSKMNRKTSDSSGDHLENKVSDNRLQNDISNLAKAEIKESTKIDELNDLINRIDSDKEENQADIRRNSKGIEDLRKDINRLTEDINQRQWLKPDVVIGIGLTIIGIGLTAIAVAVGAFYHLNFRIDNVGGRVDKTYQLLLPDESNESNEPQATTSPTQFQSNASSL